MNTSLEQQMRRLGEQMDVEQLQKLIRRTSTEQLTEMLTAKLSRNDCITFWNYLLLGCNNKSQDAREKRFSCVRCFLDGLRTVELSFKQTFDLVARLCQELGSFSPNELVDIIEYCMDNMRAGDAKCVGWKDLLPEAISEIATMQGLTINGIPMTGKEYKDTIIRNLYTMRWPAAILTPIADMLRAMKLSDENCLTVLNKFAGALQELSPMELPALCYQLFSMCNSANQLIIPLLALEKYFHRYYYHRLFSDMCSNSVDLNSIDDYSDKELREAEETILHHLNYCTLYKLNEQQVSIMLRNFQHTPNIILTPFMLSAIISMTAVNREPDVAKLSESILLPFLRSVIQHNEDERNLADYSVWCRDTLQGKQINLEHVFRALIDQNNDGKDVITPGLVSLSFVLLRTKQAPSLQGLAISFLTKFIRKRYIFGSGIIKRLTEWMVLEPEQNQYIDCLTMLSVADTFTVSECTQTIKTVINHFQWLPGETSMRIMSFLLPLLKISNATRDALIEVFYKAIESSELHIRQMAVFGFCMILKQLNNTNSVRYSQTASGFCTQQSISGFSLMTQSTLANRSNPQRNFDMLTLEIISALRNCFDQLLDIRCTLYENLQRAVELNTKLVPHVLQFIDWHFRRFFDSPVDERCDATDTEFTVHFELAVSAKDEQLMDLELNDNVGYLVQFVAHCLAIFEHSPTGFDSREMQRLLTLCIERVINGKLSLEKTSTPASYLKCELVQQQLNLIEGLISHLVLSSKPNNNIIRQILPLFLQHQKLSEGLQSLEVAAKKFAKSSKIAEGNASKANVTINGERLTRSSIQIANIWDLSVLQMLLHLLHDDHVPFASAEHTSQLRSNVPLVRYVLEITAQKMEQIRREPDYKQLAYSKRTLHHLTDITKVIYVRCICRLPELWRNFDVSCATLATKCLVECLRTAHKTYKKRFCEFVKGFNIAVVDKYKEVTYVIQEVIDEFMQDDATENSETTLLDNKANACQLPINLLQALEILYDYIGYEERATSDSYSWLLHFCRTYELANSDLSIVHRLLFTQRQKTHAGSFLDAVAKQLGKVLGFVNDGSANDSDVEDLGFKSISRTSAESCLLYLYSVIAKQIEDVNYFIGKSNNLNYKCRIVSHEDREYWQGNLEKLDRSICTQLVHLSNALLMLTNVCIPLGACMEKLLNLLTQHYDCLKNLAKHYLDCCCSGTSSVKIAKIELLLSVVGKPLPTNIYKLIPYIEANILEEQNKAPNKRNPQTEKGKVLRETKLIPRTIMAIEAFNRLITQLSKKINGRLADYLHFGTVRDFRVKTTELIAVIERTYSHSSQIDDDDSTIVEADICENVSGDETNENTVQPMDKQQDKPSRNMEKLALKRQNVEKTEKAQLQKNIKKIKKPRKQQHAGEEDDKHQEEHAEKPAQNTKHTIRRRRNASSDVEEEQPKRRRGRPVDK